MKSKTKNRKNHNSWILITILLISSISIFGMFFIRGNQNNLNNPNITHLITSDRMFPKIDRYLEPDYLSFKQSMIPETLPSCDPDISDQLDMQLSNISPYNLLVPHTSTSEDQSSLGSDMIMSTSIAELFHTTPREEWMSTYYQFIVQFSSIDVMNTFILCDSNSEIDRCQTIPFAIINTNLESIKTLQGSSDVITVFLDSTYEIKPLSIDGLEGAASAYSSDSSVNSFEADDEGFFTFPTYPIYQRIGAQTLHDLGITGEGTTIAILDSGISPNHPDLDDMDNDPNTNDPKIIKFASFINGNNGEVTTDQIDPNPYHGTGVAGIAAANGSFMGVAPGASILSARITDGNWISSFSSVLRAIDWATVENADVISLSIKFKTRFSNEYMQLINAAMNLAWENGVICVVAAGNDGPTPHTIPRLNLGSRMLTVGGSDYYDLPVFFSSRGPTINGVLGPDIVAPAAEVLGTCADDGYWSMSGTSLSTPIVSGVMALLKSAYPTMDIDLIRAAILTTATDLGRPYVEQGNGMVNATAAYEFLATLDTVYASPGISADDPLKLSPGEKYEYILDIFLNQSFNSLNLEVSSELSSYVTTTIQNTDLYGWIRATIAITMSNSALNGYIRIKDGMTSYYEVPLVIELDQSGNDANSGTDAGESLCGALHLSLDQSIQGEVINFEKDLYSFTVVAGHAYTIILSELSDDLDLVLTDINGMELVASKRIGTKNEDILVVAPFSTQYFIEVTLDNDLTTWQEYSDIISYELVVSETIAPPGIYETIYAELSDFRDFDVDFNSITFYLDLNVYKASEFIIAGEISQVRNDYQIGKYVINHYVIWEFFEEGTHRLQIKVYADEFNSFPFTGEFIMNEISLEQAYEKDCYRRKLEYHIDDFRTPFLSSDDFNTPLCQLVSTEISSINVDSQGLPELLQINCTIDFQESDAYEIEYHIRNSMFSEWQISNYDWYGINKQVISTEVLTPGIYEVSGTFAALAFFNYPQLVLGGLVISKEGGGETRIPLYQLISEDVKSEFDPLIDFSISDRAVDQDNNGNNDTIELIVSVTAKQQLNGQFTTYTPFSQVSCIAIPYETESTAEDLIFEEGTNNYIISCDARRFAARQLEAPYIFNFIGITIYEYSFFHKIHYLTEYYDITTFDLPSAYIDSDSISLEIFSNETDSGYLLEMDVIATEYLDSCLNIDLIHYGVDPSEKQFDHTFGDLEVVSTLEEGTNHFEIFVDGQELVESGFQGNIEVVSINLTRIDLGISETLDFIPHATLLEDNDDTTINNVPPNRSINPSPADGATDVTTSPDLSVEVSDPNGDTLTVRFYDASNDNIIDVVYSVPNGSIASINWQNLESGREYRWYVIVDDGIDQRQSETWSFRTVGEQPLILGDVNNDGFIDIVDALLTAQYFVGLNPNNFHLEVADVNANGSIDIVDALLIAQYFVGLINEFPANL